LRIAKSAGFTLIEAIAVLLLIGVVGAVVLTTAPSIDSYRLASEVQTLKGHLRYAQLRAMSAQVPWGISYMGASYTLLKGGAPVSFHLPNENSATHLFPSGISITSAAGSASFDQWGSPGGVNLVIVLNGSETITITRNTGFIP